MASLEVTPCLPHTPYLPNSITQVPKPVVEYARYVFLPSLPSCYTISCITITLTLISPRNIYFSQISRTSSSRGSGPCKSRWSGAPTSEFNTPYYMLTIILSPTVVIFPEYCTCRRSRSLADIGLESRLVRLIDGGYPSHWSVTYLEYLRPTSLCSSQISSH